MTTSLYIYEYTVKNITDHILEINNNNGTFLFDAFRMKLISINPSTYSSNYIYDFIKKIHNDSEISYNRIKPLIFTKKYMNGILIGLSLIKNTDDEILFGYSEPAFIYQILHFLLFSSETAIP